jgi:diguanylate cyclase (GGDEF)-like protein
VAREVEAAALMALERLEDQGALRRLSSVVDRGGQVLRYHPVDSSEVITLELPGPLEQDGVFGYSRASLPTRAAADLQQVRRLLHLDDPGLITDPRSSEALQALHGQLGLAGLELLQTDDLHLFPLADGTTERIEGALDAALAATALANPRRLYYCPDLGRHPRLATTATIGPARSVVILAVTSGDGRPLGLLEVRTPRPMPFSPDDLARVSLLADVCGAVLERAARLEKLVFVDASTGVYNRAYFELQARNEMARAQRESASIALCIVDIDDFKSFNTQYGYEAGNAVLNQVAQSLTHGVRPFDTVARWGGEEFAVLLTSPVEEHDAQSISERLRLAVERMSLLVEGLDRRAHRVGVTVSIGVAMFPEHGETPQEMWRAANQALLLAKRPPKNNVVFHRR